MHANSFPEQNWVLLLNPLETPWKFLEEKCVTLFLRSRRSVVTANYSIKTSVLLVKPRLVFEKLGVELEVSGKATPVETATEGLRGIQIEFPTTLPASRRFSVVGWVVTWNEEERGWCMEILVHQKSLPYGLRVSRLLTRAFPGCLAPPQRLACFSATSGCRKAWREIRSA